MKREDILDAMGYIDDQYIEEADQTRREEKTDGPSEKITPVRRKTAYVRRWGTLAASLAVLVIAAVVLTGVLRTRSGNMDAMQSTEAVAIKEEQGEQFKTEETETAAAAAEEYEAEEPVHEAAEAFEAEEPVYEAAEAFEAEEPVYEAAEAFEAEEPVYDAAEAFEAEEAAGGIAKVDQAETTVPAADEIVRIRVLSDAGEVVFALNDTPAARSLAARLPLSADAEPYSDNEIVFDPGEPLDTENGMEGGGTAGCLGYYEPWNNVVMYYGDFDEYPGLYILGKAVSGAENIKDIRGRITIDVL